MIEVVRRYKFTCDCCKGAVHSDPIGEDSDPDGKMMMDFVRKLETKGAWIFKPDQKDGILSFCSPACEIKGATQ